MMRVLRMPSASLLSRFALLAALAAPAVGADEPPAAPAKPLTPAQVERLKERDRFGEQAQNLRAEGKLAEAIKAAEAMLAIERDVLGPDSDDAIGSLEILAEIHLAREDWTAARKVRREALDRLTARLGKDHWRVADARRAIADVKVIASLTAEQRRRLREAGRLESRRHALYQKGQYLAATDPARQALAIRREVQGERHPDTLTSLNNLASLLEDQGELKAARPLYERALELRREVLGERHPDTITSLNNLAYLLKAQGDLKAARPLYERALELNREVLGERHPGAIISLNNLAGLLKARGELKTARPMYERALELNREVLGERHPGTIISLNNLAALLEDQGDRKAARPMFERALVLRREVLGERHPQTITSLNNLAHLLVAQGEWKAARPLYERALELRREVLGEHHPDTITSLNNLASLLKVQGDLKAARPMFERALVLRREVLGEHHPDTITSLNNLAILLVEQGDLKAARPLYERALELGRDVQGERHPDTITSLNNLASLLEDQGELKAARPMFERALELRREMLGERHPQTIGSLNNLASLLEDQGELKAARPMFEWALELMREVQGERHPDTITSLNSLAVLLVEQRDLKAARPMYERALELRREMQGERHPDTLTSLNNLAVLLVAQGDLKAARPLARQALEAAEQLARELLPILTEREQISYLEAVRYRLDVCLSLTAAEAGSDGEAYRHVLAWKGLTAQAAVARRKADSTAARGLKNEIAPLRARLNAMYFAQVSPEKAADHARAIKELVDRIARKESELARAVDWKPEPPEPKVVADALPSGAVLIDLLRYVHGVRSERERRGLHFEPRYVAFVVRRGAQPERVELGPAAAIDEALHAWRKRLEEGDDAEEMGRKLAGLVWTPIVGRLGGARTVLVSPDWQLSFLPWSALPDEQAGSFLIRRYTFGTLVSARQLVERAGRRSAPAEGGLLAVGGVDYGKADSGPVAVASRAAAVDRGSMAFGPLPGTADEAREVVELYRKADSGRVEAISGSSATRERVRAAMVGRRYLHLATHGFFAPPEVRSALAPVDAPTGLKSWEGMGRGEVRGFYPGLLSGLVWAGAASPSKSRITGVDDPGAGLMTAEEVESMDLAGCELAVLSACETGLGATAGGEGVRGLQSAFDHAGCRRVVASLWRVDDAATRTLMRRFYANLWQKNQPALEALRNAQLSVLDESDLDDGGNPRLWAAWVFSGDPGR